MKKYILYLIVSLITTNSFSQDSTLFVGNSMVKYDKNHTLEILQRILNNQTKKNIIDDVACNGCSLNSHVRTLPPFKENFFGSSTSTTNKIELAATPSYIISNNFKKVLFQETPMRVLDSTKFFKKTLNDFYRLDSLTKNYSNQIYWLEPYAAIYSLSDNNSNINLDSLYNIIYQRFVNLKQIDSNLINVPIAYIVKEFIKKYPNENLQIGGHHPNKRMQFILACCLYYSMYNGYPDEIPFLHLFKNDKNQIKEKGLKEYTYNLYKDYLTKYQ